MPETLRACHCPPALPATCAALERAGGRAVDLGLEELALFAICFDAALILTTNHGALVEGRGGYAALQRTGTPLRLNPRRPAIRVQGWRALPVLLSPAGADGPAALSVAAGDGRIQHRIQIAGDDLIRAETLPHLAATPTAAPLRPRPDNVFSLVELRQRRATWAQLSMADRIDDILHDGGAARCAYLPLIGAGARRVQPQILPSFIRYLCRQNRSIAVTVPVDGMAQTLLGDALRCGTLGPMILCDTTSGRFALDPAHIASLWVTRHGADAALELYDAHRTCLAILHAPPCPTWASYLEAMPSTL